MPVVRLIVNADDFGYYAGVSAGILEAIDAGVVTATGVMANGPVFASHVPKLRTRPEVDAGVHLNLTHGPALSPDFPALSTDGHGMFPSKQVLVSALLTGKLSIAAVAAEWRAQIEKCSAAGLSNSFLNSHEHIHMLPILYPVIQTLAREFQIPYVRHTTPEWGLSYGWAAGFRALLMGGLGVMRSAIPGTPRMLGLAPSGHLDLSYLERTLPTLKDKCTYELMCHPGRQDAAASAEPGLRRYHDWTGELDCLLSSEFRALLARSSIQLIRFRDTASKQTGMDGVTR